MKNNRSFGRLNRDQRGTYLVEFAMISLPLVTLLMGSIELGYYAYAKSNVEGALRAVARLATTGTATPEELEAKFIASVSGLSNATVVIEPRSYASFEDVAQPEPRDGPDFDPVGGVPDVGECWIDINPNLEFDADRGVDNLGNAEDVLYYGVTVTYPLLFGFSSALLNGGSPNMTIEANAVIKNEPFGSVVDSSPLKVCQCASGQTWDPDTLACA